MTERIGIMGGMFDPVHVGHVKVAIAAQQALQLDELRLVPCSIPNHRGQALCSPRQRLDMLELAVHNHPLLRVDDRELNRPGISYTYDTLISLREELPRSILCFVLGVDAFASLETWHRWQQLFSLCHFIVVRRLGVDRELSDELKRQVQNRKVSVAEELFERESGLIYDMEGLDSPVSSSMVRDLIAREQSLERLLDPAVAAYLERHQFYRNAIDACRDTN